jgi:hypothetical protein
MLCLAALLLSGCVTTPQTRDEFKSWTKAHNTVAIYENHTINRPLENVAASLQKKWQQCYNLDVTTTRKSGGMTTSRYTDTFHPKFRRINGSQIEMTLQMTTEGMIMLNKTPEGGEYNVALDLERIGPGRTKLTWHSYTWGGWRDAWELNKKWGEGQGLPCLR